MPWDLTPDEADKFNRLSKGEKVDLSSDEATKFQPIFAERAKLKKPEAPGLGSLAWNAAKEMVIPSADETGNPTVDWEDAALAAGSSMDIGFRPPPLKGSSSPQEMEKQRLKSGSDVDSAFDLARRRHPKTALTTGLLMPFPNKVKEQALVAGGLGALHGFVHSKPGEGVHDAVVNGLLNAGFAAATGKVVQGAGKLLGPATRALMERLGVKAPELALEPKTMPESPVDVAARESAAAAARGGEPKAVPENLKTPWFGEPQDPALTKVGEGALTKASVRPNLEPPTQRSLLAGRRTRADVEGPTNVSDLSARAAKMLESGPLPGEPNTAGKLEAVRGMSAERPTVVDDPRMAQFLRESGFNEAASAADRGESSLMLKWLKDNPQGAKMAEQAGLLHASEYRKYAGPQELTKPPLTSSMRDEMGTKSLRSPTPAVPSEPSVADNIAWLNGEGSAPEPKTLTKYVPRDSLLPKNQQNPEMTWVKSSRLNPAVGGGSGAPEPVRPSAVQQSGPPVSAPLDPSDMHEDFLAQVKESQQLLRDQMSNRAKIAQQLSLPENRADDVDKLLGMSIRSFKATKTAQDIQMQSLFPRLKAAVEKLPLGQRAVVKNIIAKLRDRSATLDEVAKLPEEFRDLFKQTQAESQAQLVQLAKAGYFSPAEISTISKNLKKGLLHLHRTYAAFATGKKWRAPDEAVDRAARWIADENGISFSDALSQTRAILKTAADGEGFRTVQDLANALRNNGLVKRRILPPQLHALLGVVNDPAFVVAETASQMTALHQLYLRTRAFADPAFQGRIWSDTPMPGMDERKLWFDALSPADNKRAFGELAGKYVPATLREAMVDTPSKAVNNVFLSLAKKATNWFSFSKVLTSPLAAVRDVISSGFYMTSSGVPQLWQASKFVPAIKALLALHGDFKGLPEGASLARMALEDGAIQLGKGSDFGGSEARRIVEEALKGASEGLPGIWDKVTSGYSNTRAKLGLIRELLDNAGRLTAYMYHLKTAHERLGLSDLEARAHASHIVNRYFATGAGVPPVVRALQKGQAGLAPFIGWNVDNMRVAKNILADVAKGDFGPLMRASIWMGGPFAASALLNHALGITDEDKAAGERALKGSWKATHPLRIWLPFRGPDGKLVYVVSLDGINPMAKFFQGTDQMNPAQRVAASLVNGLTDSGMFEGWSDRVLARAGIQPQQYEPDLLPGQEGYAFASDIANYAEPTLMHQYRTVARRAQLDVPGAEPLRPTEEPLGLGHALLAGASPLSLEKVGPRSLRGAQKQLRGERGELLDVRKQAGRMQDPSERSRVLDAVKERFGDLRRKFAK